MKTIQEQIANKCIHFNGLMNDKCDKGIFYNIVEVKEARPRQIPCLRESLLSGGQCTDVCFPTEEEAEKQAQEVIEQGSQTMEAYAAIRKSIKETKNMTGSVACPKCKGKLNYTASSSNGHVWAKCKCGFGWME